MKIINYNLENSIREALAKDCPARCLDDRDDFEAVMTTIERTITAWMKNRCEGCK